VPVSVSGGGNQLMRVDAPHRRPDDGDDQFVTGWAVRGIRYSVTPEGGAWCHRLRPANVR
jgi:hypothetical protein